MSITKAVAIILMVLCHAHVGGMHEKVIALFHMPLFFFMSGYCFKSTYLTDFWTFLKRRFQGIYWPYVKWSLIFLLLHNIFCKLNIYNGEYGFNGMTFHPYSVSEMIGKAFHIVIKMYDEEILLGGYWFLNSLMWGSLLFYLCRRFAPRLLGGAILLVLSMALSYFHWHVPGTGLYSRSFLASFFILVGNEYRESGFQIERHNTILYIAPFFLLMAAWLFPAGMLSYEWWQVIPYSFTAIIGTLMTFRISTLIDSYSGSSRKILLYIGDNTLEILTWHFLSFKLVSLIIICFYGLPIKYLSYFPVIEPYASGIWLPLYWAIGVVAPLMLYGAVRIIKNRICNKIYG